VSEIKAELHSHSLVSDGSMSPGYLVKLAAKRGCNVIAVTDHDTFRGSLEAIKALKFYNLDKLIVIPSAEIRTFWGDVLVYCPQLPEGEPPKDPYDLKDWGEENSCILVPAHPLHPLRSSIGYKNLIRGRELWDAIEVWNSRGPAIINYITLKVSKKLNLPLTSGSDAHVPSELCTSYSLIEISSFDVEEVIKSIRNGRIRPTFNIEGVRARLESLAWALERRVIRSSTTL
jgi:predicted metal-dependent phosphoesterase TrpH